MFMRNIENILKPKDLRIVLDCLQESLVRELSKKKTSIQALIDSKFIYHTKLLIYSSLFATMLQSKKQ